MFDLRNLRPDSGFINNDECSEGDKMIDVEKMKNILRMYDDLLASMLRSHDNRSIELPRHYVRDIESILGSCNDIIDE
jgi:hypothetical protein